MRSTGASRTWRRKSLDSLVMHAPCREGPSFVLSGFLVQRLVHAVSWSRQGHW